MSPWQGAAIVAVVFSRRGDASLRWHDGVANFVIASGAKQSIGVPGAGLLRPAIAGLAMTAKRDASLRWHDGAAALAFAREIL